MEFKIWGRLDESGRIQSIQSNCSGVNHDVGSLPYVCSGSHDKKLVYKLDSKTDEMSMLILQISEMSKRIQLHEKYVFLLSFFLSLSLSFFLFSFFLSSFPFFLSVFLLAYTLSYKATLMKVDLYRCGENSRMYDFYVRKFSMQLHR